MSERLTVTSEIFTEEENFSEDEDQQTKNTVDSVTYFKFKTQVPTIEDCNLATQEKEYETLKIEHSRCTVLDLVGLQVWRGALLLADFVMHFGNSLFKDKVILELGSGVGLTSIVGAMYAHRVVCSDIDSGGILETIRKNVIHNKHLSKSDVEVVELDFCNRNWSSHLQSILSTVNVVLAADVIYDNGITEEFVKTLVKLSALPSMEGIYLAVEKRYVFTLKDLDTVAPCYDYFIRYLEKTVRKLGLDWKVDYVKIDFPKYFDYLRTDHLVLLKITTQ